MSCKALLALVIASASFVSSTAWAERVVSIGGTVTEIVYLLGESDQLVATDTSSVYPEAANQTPKVGYQRTLSAEGVLSVRPDMLLLTTTAGPQSVLRQLEDTGIQSKVIDTPRTKQGILDAIQTVANALQVPAKGQTAVAEVEAAFDQLERPQNWTKAPRLLFIMQMGGSPMIAGRDTGPDGLFNLTGAINAAGDVQGYKNLTPEALMQAQPDAIVVTSHGSHGSKADTIWRIPGIKSTPAAQAKRLIELDTLLALGFGPRTPQAIEAIYQQMGDWTP